MSVILRVLGWTGATLLGLAVVGVLWPLTLPEPPRDVSDLAVRGVTVVEVESGRTLAAHTILIRGGRIVARGPDSAVVVPRGVRVVDGSGLHALPGLWDMHAHITTVSPWLDLPLFVASGVTNVRDMLGCPTANHPFIACPSDKKRWTDEVRRGERVGPRVVMSASFMANGPINLERVKRAPPYFATRTADEARSFVRRAHREGAEMIKVYDHMPHDAFEALSDEARHLRMPVVGHRPHGVSARDAAARMQSLEHARFLLHESWPGADAMRDSVRQGGRFRESRRAMIDQHDPARAESIFVTMHEHRTAYVPTHLTRWADANADHPTVRQDTLLQYLHPLLRMQWKEDLDEVLHEDSSAAGRQAYREFHEAGLRLTGAAHRAGVTVLAGTDYLVGGPTLHRELALLVEAGMSPLDALRAATIEPARWFGDTLGGRLAVGAVADLVLVDGDPTVDITRTAHIRAVIMDGRVYDTEALDGLRSHVRRAAGSWTIGVKMLWRFLRHPASM